jgi:hypothetical protein
VPEQDTTNYIANCRSNPTIDSIVDPTVKASADFWPTTTPTGILSLELNIKKKK